MSTKPCAPLDRKDVTATELAMRLSPTRQQALAEEGIRAFKEHMRLVEKLAVYIHSISLPKMTVHPDGSVQYEHSEWTKERLAEIDKLAEQVKDGFPWAQYGLTRPT